MSILMNILWIVLGGFCISLTHLAFSIVLCITIIGIPFGRQHFKLAALALPPFGKHVVENKHFLIFMGGVTRKK